MLFDLNEVSTAVCGKMSGENVLISKVCIDSRKVEKGCMFVCLKGENTDGHNYINSALQNGALGILCSKKPEVECNYVLVEDTEYALLLLAKYYAQKFDTLNVAVTGSVGKTTTKEFIYSVLSQKYNTHKSKGNLNSVIGLPLSVFELNESNEAAVFEMGMSGVGEIEKMSDIVSPRIAVITNIGVSHIEKLGSKEGIFKAKLEIIKGMKKGGYLVVNGDDLMLKTLNGNDDYKVLKYSIKNKDADFHAFDINFNKNETEFKIRFKNEEYSAIINTVGLHNVLNALCAICVGYISGIDIQECIKGLLNFNNAGKRQDIFDFKGITIIDDSYNASPDSMKAAFSVLNQYNSRKIAVLSDMLELGKNSVKFHKQVGEAVASKTDILYCFGNNAKYYVQSAISNGMEPKNAVFDSKQNIIKRLKKEARPGDVILFKGSRSMACDEVLEGFMA